MRKYVDCREQPSGRGCGLKISGGEQEVTETAHDHMVKAHGHSPGEALKQKIRSFLKDEDEGAERTGYRQERPSPMA